MLTPEQAFKVAFLQKCAEVGLSLEETHELIKVGVLQEKSALTSLLTAPWNAMWSAGGSLAKTLGHAGLAAAVAGPPALGYAGGYALGKSTDLSDEDAKELRKRQLINEYRRLIENTKNRRRVPV